MWRMGVPSLQRAAFPPGWSRERTRARRQLNARAGGSTETHGYCLHHGCVMTTRAGGWVTDDPAKTREKWGIWRCSTLLRSGGTGWGPELGLAGGSVVTWLSELARRSGAVGQGRLTEAEALKDWGPWAGRRDGRRSPALSGSPTAAASPRLAALVGPLQTLASLRVEGTVLLGLTASSSLAAFLVSPPGPLRFDVTRFAVVVQKSWRLADSASLLGFGLASAHWTGDDEHSGLTAIEHSKANDTHVAALMGAEPLWRVVGHAHIEH